MENRLDTWLETLETPEIWFYIALKQADFRLERTELKKESLQTN